MQKFFLFGLQDAFVIVEPLIHKLVLDSCLLSAFFDLSLGLFSFLSKYLGLIGFFGLQLHKFIVQ